MQKLPIQKSNEQTKIDLTIHSSTFPQAQIEQIISVPNIYQKGHFEYPVSLPASPGNHLDAVFLLEPITVQHEHVVWIVDDLCRWIDNSDLKFNLIFAPAQPAVMQIVDQLAERLRIRKAYLEYLPSGWFGEKLVYGKIEANDIALVYNGISQTGRCIGKRLPSFIEKSGGRVLAGAAFMIGTAGGIDVARSMHKNRLYSAITAPVTVQAPQDCLLCKQNQSGDVEQKPLIPWTTLRDRVLGSV
jgi:hypothetical protein